MRIIDANTGAEIQQGIPFTNIDGTHTLLAVREGWFHATAQFMSAGRPGRRWTPLVVRYLHPGFFLQKIGFFPS